MQVDDGITFLLKGQLHGDALKHPGFAGTGEADVFRGQFFPRQRILPL